MQYIGVDAPEEGLAVFSANDPSMRQRLRKARRVSARLRN